MAIEITQHAVIVGIAARVDLDSIQLRAMSHTTFLFSISTWLIMGCYGRQIVLSSDPFLGIYSE